MKNRCEPTVPSVVPLSFLLALPGIGRIGVMAALLLCCNFSLGQHVKDAETASPSQARPNIILIMTDDMNYGCCCGEEIARENHCFSPSSEMN